MVLPLRPRVRLCKATENACNHRGYCNAELEKLYERQSMEPDEGRRKKLVWEIESIAIALQIVSLESRRTVCACSLLSGC